MSRGTASGRKALKPRKPATPAVVYPPGFFTEPARAWGVVAPAMELGLPDEVVQQRQRDANTKRSRAAALSMGNGWGNGTMVMPGTPRNAAPVWMVRAPRRGSA
jgi:hypothetical protein